MATMTPSPHFSGAFIAAKPSPTIPPNALYGDGFSPDFTMAQMLVGDSAVQSYERLPTMPTTPHFFTSPSTFKPLAPPTNSIRGAVNIPRTSPFEYRKPSPTPSHQTATTADSSFDANESPRPSSRNSGMPLWVGPRDSTVCRILEKSFDAHRGGSPLADFNKAANINSRHYRDDDLVRKSKLKTELCLHYENGTHCPFGASCTYAHGPEELQMTKLMDLHRAGLVELETYRTKPCLTWVSTGSCPFGKRCSGIHDPRTAGSQQSWLPHTETQGNTIATDINVEALHQKRLHAIHYNNPFGDLFQLDQDGYDDLYKLICNIPTSHVVVPPRNKRNQLAEHFKVDIALQMRGPAEWQYKFRPQHIIYDELCMVLQKRAFRLTETKGAIEIPLSVYKSKRYKNNQVLVREIAFGPDSDPTVRGVSLWFDIDDKDVTVCTPQQAKRYRWKKGFKPTILSSNGTAIAPRALSPTMPFVKRKSTAFDSKDCFIMVRPLDKDAYDLGTKILAHHLGVLRSERIANLSDRWEARSALQAESAALKESFDNLKQYWQSWTWPINQGRAKKITEHTPVPPIDGEYNPVGTTKTSRKKGKEGSGVPAVQRIWQSFVCDDVGGTPSHRRLAVLEQLAEGCSVSNGGSRPHICKPVVKTKKDSCTSDSERCWKALLLSPVYPHYEANEWKAVLEHFSNSRSKKVLGILQSNRALSPTFSPQ